jgi:CBS domain-containing protein
MKLLKVSEAMSKGVASFDADSTIEQAAKLMTEKNVRTIIVENKIGSPVGLVTGGDIVKSVARKLGPNIKVDEIVTKELITIDADADIMDAAKIMNEKNIKRLAVVDKGKIIGILTANDVLKYSPKYLHEFSVTLEKLDAIIKKL